jgi:hypothetical protein
MARTDKEKAQASPGDLSNGDKKKKKRINYKEEFNDAVKSYMKVVTDEKLKKQQMRQAQIEDIGEAPYSLFDIFSDNHEGLEDVYTEFSDIDSNPFGLLSEPQAPSMTILPSITPQDPSKAFMSKLQHYIGKDEAHHSIISVETVSDIILECYGRQIMPELQSVCYCGNVNCGQEATFMCTGCLLQHRFCFFCTQWSSIKRSRASSYESSSSLSSNSSTPSLPQFQARNCRYEAHNTTANF